MSHQHVEQTTIPQLREMLEHCRGNLERPHTTWNSRVQALQEAASMRMTWPEPQDKELRVQIRQYLYNAGATL